MAVFGQREDLYTVTVTIVGSDGAKCKFTFDSFDGGSVTAKDTKYRPGNGTEDEQSLGGPNQAANVTVKALMTYAMYLWVPWMMVQSGKATMYVNKQPLDVNGAPFGTALSYKGKLISCDPPKTDSNADTPGLLTLGQSTVTPVNGPTHP